MNRRQFIKTVGAAGATLYAGATLAAKRPDPVLLPAQTKNSGRPPNIVYIMSDELATMNYPIWGIRIFAPRALTVWQPRVFGSHRHWLGHLCARLFAVHS
jgi:hypothetical protein